MTDDSGLPVLLLQDIAVMARAYEAHTEALARYNQACRTWNWVAAEEARIVAVGSLEAFLDAIAAAYKFAESSR